MISTLTCVSGSITRKHYQEVGGALVLIDWFYLPVKMM